MYIVDNKSDFLSNLKSHIRRNKSVLDAIAKSTPRISQYGEPLTEFLKLEINVQI